MKNKQTIYLAIGLITLVFGASVAHAASFEPTSQTYYVEPGSPIRIVNNNYNTNVNDNPAPVVVATPDPEVAYANSVHTQAQNNLPGCTTCGTTAYRLVKTGSCGAAVAYADATVAKPSCTIVPTMTANGAVQLTWRTNGATVAFIDSGIGHVSLVNGSRVVTPTENTTYNLTVLNDNGVAGACQAKVTISDSAATTYTATVVNAADEVEAADEIVVESDGEAKSGFLSIFSSDTFKKVALPVLLVFGILIALLMLLMSRIKAAK